MQSTARDRCETEESRTTARRRCTRAPMPSLSTRCTRVTMESRTLIRTERPRPRPAGPRSRGSFVASDGPFGRPGCAPSCWSAASAQRGRQRTERRARASGRDKRAPATSPRAMALDSAAPMASTSGRRKRVIYIINIEKGTRGGVTICPLFGTENSYFYIPTNSLGERGMVAARGADRFFQSILQYTCVLISSPK